MDEAPQLINVLRGEMSLVGPRPLPLAYLPRYTLRQATRLRVRPGLAGLAQSHGRNAVPWDARLEWDARYAEAVSLRCDLMAALGTLGVLLSGHGVTAPGHATMPELARPGTRDDGTGSGAPKPRVSDHDNFVPKVAFPLADSPPAAPTSR
ncbi:sugar transferase [Roseomonas sp. SXEYE001]|uniref:sugar transferase n=1 Tax=Roseomonas xinghualingensis TaxID=2986475 RepID=UPI0021F1F744|nr:sugar transferase [Roseomonas sp. SXEYE001]